MQTKLVKGTPVVDISDGAKLGVVEAVYLDPKRLAIVGFSVQRTGHFGLRATGLVDIRAVRGIGPDVVTVAGLADGGLPLTFFETGLVDLADLIKRPVVTEGGVVLGRVTGIQFAHDSHHLIAIEVVSRTEARLVVEAARIVTIGKDLVVVSDVASPVSSAVPLHLLTPIEDGLLAATG